MIVSNKPLKVKLSEDGQSVDAFLYDFKMVEPRKCFAICWVPTLTKWYVVNLDQVELLDTPETKINLNENI